MQRMSNAERTKYFDAVVQLLSSGSPDLWSKDTGHEFDTWTPRKSSKYEKCLPHIKHLVKQFKKYSISTNDPQKLGELLIPCVQ